MITRDERFVTRHSVQPIPGIGAANTGPAIQPLGFKNSLIRVERQVSGTNCAKNLSNCCIFMRVRRMLTDCSAPFACCLPTSSAHSTSADREAITRRLDESTRPERAREPHGSVCLG